MQLFYIRMSGCIAIDIHYMFSHGCNNHTAIDIWYNIIMTWLGYTIIMLNKQDHSNYTHFGYITLI